MPKRTFVYGAVILLGANLLNRLLGFTYQYLILSKIGGEALGLFNMVFPVYMMALVLTTAGIPLAVSKMIAEEVANGHREKAAGIFRLALTILGIAGAVVAIALYYLAPFLSDKIFPDPRVLNIFLICTPAIFIVSIASAFRGYFQGMQNMLPTALSQISEQVVRVIIGFYFAMRFLERGVEWAAIGLAIGMVAGEAVGLAMIIIQYMLNSRTKLPRLEKLPSPRPILSSLFKLSSPITLGRLLATGISSLDAIIIPKRLLFAGYTAREATSLFGHLGGSAFTLLSFPSVFTFALATSLVPSISEAAAQKQMHVVRARSSEAIRLTVLLGIPCLFILFFYAEPLTGFFKSASMAPILRILTLGGIFLYLQQTSSGILQGLGKVYLPVLNSIAGAAVRLPALYVLTGLPHVGISGIAWSYVLGYMIVASLNISAVIRHSGMAIDLHHFLLQPLSAGLGMMLVFKLGSTLSSGSSWLGVLFFLSGCVAYLGILRLNGGMSSADIRRIPWLGKYFPR